LGFGESLFFRSGLGGPHQPGGVKMKYRKSLLGLILLFSFLLFSLLIFNQQVFSETYPAQKSDKRELQADLAGWYMPKTVTATSGVYYVDVREGGFFHLDTTSATGGTSLFITGTSLFPVHGFIVYQGNNYNFSLSTASGTPIVYQDGGAWPFDAVNATGYGNVYVLEYWGGVGDSGGGNSGNTVFLSGETYYQ